MIDASPNRLESRPGSARAVLHRPRGRHVLPPLRLADEDGEVGQREWKVSRSPEPRRHPRQALHGRRDEKEFPHVGRRGQ